MKGLKPAGRWPSGNVRYYYRYTTPATPMPDAPKDSPEFLRAYTDAAAGKPTKVRGKIRHRTGTIGAGIRAFLASDAYMARATSTRARWRSFAEEFEEFFATARLADLEPRHIRRYLAQFGPHPANNRLKLWRAMGRWWVDNGLLDADPARDVRKRAAPESDGHTPWTAADATAFRYHWPIGSMQRLAFELLAQTGAAIGDAVTLGPGNLRNGWLTYRRTKSKTLCTVPLFVTPRPAYYPSSEDLRTCIEAAPKHLTWLSTARGGSRSPKAAGQWFSKAAREAGIEGKTAHGVRKYLATYMAEHGATEAQRMAILGHDTTAQTRDYSKTADARKIIQGTDFDNFSDPVDNLSHNALKT
ncbi:tyrosine-type recombinase/integrase [Sediminimonas qiaohouensis]|uniref:tyrosine-type recombinase/integrase n=1 Tax=Sediminimonas qiaohouensis TaxID=552061 RepID=UPI00146ADF84|nr:site-specific integrase [Sediminimonas qiaohouensis]